MIVIDSGGAASTAALRPRQHGHTGAIAMRGADSSRPDNRPDMPKERPADTGHIVVTPTPTRSFNQDAALLEVVARHAIGNYRDASQSAFFGSPRTCCSQ